MIPEIVTPSAHLRPYISQYWAIETRLDKPFIYRIIPSGMTELTFYFHGLPRVSGCIQSFPDSYLLSGHSSSYTDLRLNGHLSVFSITFRPEGLMAFFKMPAVELFNQSIPLGLVSPRLANLLINHLEDCPDIHSRVAWVEEIFTRLLQHEINRYEYGRMRHVISVIKATHGQSPVTLLASEACLSRKQLERQFSNLVGISPKQYLKTIRLQSALHLKASQPDLSLAALACDSGYFDQAHLTREFKSLTGLTPRQYFDTCEPYSDFFS